MRYAQRVQDIDISGIRKAFEGVKGNAINLGLGQPDFDTPQHIKDAAIQAIREGFTGYSHGMGIPELREAIADKLKRDNNIEASPENIIVTSGASEALHIALEALVDEGDEVIIPDPGFVAYKNLALISGARPVGAPLTELKMTAEGVNEVVTSKSRVLVINSPSNPTGTVLSKKDVKGLCEVAEDYNLTIISDEVYEHMTYGCEHISPAVFYENVVTVNATSKTYAMTGWRLGYASAQPDLLLQMLKVHQYIQACACSISQRAALAALTGPQDFVFQMREEYQRRRDILLDGLEDIGLECIRPSGAFYAFPSTENTGMDGDTLSGMLMDQGVITVPGSSFGEGGKWNIRISYSNSQQSIKVALERMKKVLSM
ncbi:MAG: pyridoxal phosphate-dependent aminotransferase [Methermicoccaceae archaeon]